MDPLHNTAHKRSRPQLLRLKPNAKASSIASDESVPPTSGLSDNDAQVPRFDLEKTFPAILVPILLLRRIPESEDIDALRALALIFAHCLDAILDSMAHLPEHILTSPKYHHALRGVMFSKDMFMGHINSIPLDGPHREAIHVAMQFLDITMSSIKSFLNTAAYETAQSKPLPQIPVEDDFTQVAEESDTSTLHSHSSAESHKLGSNAYSSTSHPTDAPDQPQKSKASALLNLPRCCRANTKTSCMDLPGPGSAVSSTLANGDSDDLDSGYVYVSVNIRNSLALFPISIDPTAGTPPHPEDVSEMWKDRNGLVQLASLKALIRHMTSPDADSDVEIVDVFFLCFRFFSNPKEIFDALIVRYDENPPPQTSSVTQSHSMQVKIRIARLLYLWMDLHWRAEDAVILSPLNQFTFSRLAQDIPRDASMKLVNLLYQRAYHGEKSRGLRKEKTIARAEARYRQELLDSTWEPRGKKSMMKHDFSRVKLMHFHSPGGHAMLALQLTLLLWQKYRAFEPEDAVRHLMTRDSDDGLPTPEIARKVEIFMAYERAVHRFVMDSIASAGSGQKRIELTEFFLEVAVKCHELRNYSASCLIALACDRPAVLPFITKMELSSAHERMRTTLTDFYTRENNQMTTYKQALQSCCCPALPGMMLVIREVARGCGSSRYEQHPSFPGSRLINLKCYRPITWAVRAMEKCHAPYKIRRVDYICDWLEHVLSEYLAGTEVEWEERIYNKCCQPRDRDARIPHRRGTV